MLIDYSEKGKLKIDMKFYTNDIVGTFPESLPTNVKYPWTPRLFNIHNESKLLNQHKKEIFHTFVMKCMFLAKTGHQVILTGITLLSTRVLRPNEDGRNKLM